MQANSQLQESSWRREANSKQSHEILLSVNQGPCCVYILICANGKLYVGQSRNIHQRLASHIDGTAATFTRARRILKLVYVEYLLTRTAAMARERQLKGWSRAKKEALIGGDLEGLHLLSRCRSQHGVSNPQRRGTPVRSPNGARVVLSDDP